MLRISFNTSCIGRQFLHYPVIASTNELAMQKLADYSLQDGALVVAELQTAGRGQRDASWEATEGLNLTFTVALYPGLEVEHQFYLNIMTALAVTDSLKNALGEPLSIKWPNDIYYHQSKLCGILIQNNLKVNKIQSSAVGIGLNVNQLHLENSQAVSLKYITKYSWDKVVLLQEIAQNLENRYFQLKSRQFRNLKYDYLSLLYRKDEWHDFKDTDGAFSGMILGIDEQGKLVVNRQNKLKYYDFKEITYIH